MKYFAYGSNMSIQRMKDRGVNFKSRKPAQLKGYKLVFNKTSSEGNFSYANIIQSTPSNLVEGALYEVEQKGIDILDTFEGYPHEYTRQKIIVTNINGEQTEAIIYIAREEKTKEGLIPTKQYLNHLLAAKDILSKKYYSMLAEQPYQ